MESNNYRGQRRTNNNNQRRQRGRGGGQNRQRGRGGGQNRQRGRGRGSNRQRGRGRGQNRQRDRGPNEQRDRGNGRETNRESRNTYNSNTNNGTRKRIFLRQYLEEANQNINSLDINNLRYQIQKQNLDNLRLQCLKEFIITTKLLKQIPEKYDHFLVILKDFPFFYNEIWTVYEKEIKYYRIFERRNWFEYALEIYDGFIDIYIDQFKRMPLQSKNLDFDIVLKYSQDFIDKSRDFYQMCITQQEKDSQLRLEKLGTKTNELLDLIYINEGRYDEKKDEQQQDNQSSSEEEQFTFQQDLTELDIYPDINDIMQRDPELVSHQINQPYSSYNEYRNITFRLLKEELCSSLREQLHEFKQQQQDTQKKRFRRIAIGGKLVNPVFDKRIVGVELEVYKKPKRNFSWQRTRMLMNGSLIMISSDNFRSFFFGVVRGRNIREMDKTTQKYGYARITLELNSDEYSQYELFFQNRGLELQIIESQVFFQLFYYTMDFIQKSQHLALEQELIQCKQQKDNQFFNNNRPDYIENSQQTQVIIRSFLSNSKYNLDPSQRLAIEQTFENNVAMVQGPPGTGKSYTGILIAKILRKIQMQRTHTFGPIMIVCFTNHALDQFLEHIIKYTQDVIRLGGSSKNEQLQDYSLSSISRKYKFRFSKDLYECFSDRDQILIDIKKLQKIMPFPFFQNKTYNQATDIDKQVLDYNYNYFIQFYRQAIKFINNYFKFDNVEDQNNLQTEFDNFLNNKTDDIGFMNLGILYSLQLFDIDIIAEQFIEYFENILEMIEKRKKYDEDKDKNKEKDKDKNNEEDNLNKAFEELEKQRQENQYNENIYTQQNQYDKFYNFLQKLVITKDKKYNNQRYYQLFDKLNKEYNLFSLTKDTEIKRNYDQFSYKDQYQFYYQLHLLYNEKFSDREQLLTNYSKQLQELNKQIDEIHQQKDQSILESTSFIAMTTYGALKYKQVLNNIQSTVMIVEEAAEVLDCQIITSLTKSTQHVILIGDHKQLRPKVNDMKLIKDYNFDVSLFERLINCNFKQVTLDTQRRMRPEIANITRLTYPNLKDGKETFNRQSIDQIGNLFFFTHQWKENQDEFSQSKINTKEAEFIIAFAELLIKNEIKPKQITILSLYTGQLLLIKRQMLNQKQLKDIKIATVDDFQGEENDVIILSLVRSNQSNSIGFLQNNNRINVALSRARNQLYIFGNAQTIRDFSMSDRNKQDDLLWLKVLKHFYDSKLIIEKIQLKCQIHGSIVSIKELQDFEKCPEGGCRKICSVRQECGHSCKKFCHIYKKTIDDPDGHKKYKCSDRCDKYHNCQHRCTKSCWACKESEDKNCYIKIDYTNPECLHTIQIFCHKQNDPEIFCTAPCDKFLRCWHQCQKKCGDVCDSVKKNDQDLGYTTSCREKVKIKSQCKHEVLVECRDLQNPRVNNYSKYCKDTCDKLLRCGHKCTSKCIDCTSSKILFGLTFHKGYCDKQCQRNLPCQHICQDNCSHENCSACKKECQTQCLHSQCIKKCGEICVDCQEKCKYKCEHLECSKKCFEICDRLPCEEKCQKKVKRCDHKCSKKCQDKCQHQCNEQCGKECGHDCIGLCGEKCPKICKICDKDHEDFQIFFGNEDEKDSKFLVLDCGHNIESQAMDQYVKNLTTENVGTEIEIKKLECPKCKTQVNNCMRYQKIIKKINSQFNQLKQQNKNQIEQHEEEYKDNIKFFKDNQELYNKYLKKYTPKSVNKKLFKLLKHEDFQETNYKQEQLSQVLHRTTLFRKYLEIFIWILSQDYLRQTFTKEKLICLFIEHTGYFLYLAKMPFITENIQNLQLILRGIDLYYRNYLITDRITDVQNKNILKNQLEFIIQQKFILNNQTYTEFKGIFNHKYETQEIKKVLNLFGPGHTYQCTLCGYIYIIGNCGGANQEFRCPGNNGNCNNMLGGQQHRLNANNRHLGDYDGTERNAYDQAIHDNVIPEDLLH